MELYTPEEIAQMLRLSTGTVWGYIRSGRLPASKLGRKYIISEDQLKRFLEKQEVKPGQDKDND